MESSPEILLFLAALTFIAIVILYRRLLALFQLLSNHGITEGPRFTLPVLGNFLSLNRVRFDRFIKHNVKEYGLVFGYYIGTVPKVVLSDAEILREVMVKEFEVFNERGFLGGASLIPRALGINPGLVVADAHLWKPARRALTPSFSAMKMKLMLPLIEKSTDVLVNKIGKCMEKGESMDVFKEFSLFTLEVMIATAFGQQVDIQRGEGDELTKAIKTFFQSADEGSSLDFALLTLLVSYPCLRPLLRTLIHHSMPGEALKLIYDTAVRLVEARMKIEQPSKVKDLLQLMIDATYDEDDTNQSSSKKFTSQQIAGFSVDFLLAGYETTATSLGFVSYLLAIHPDVQEKLQSEIDNYFDEKPDCTLYEAAQDIKYLDMVISESLRLYTPLTHMQRHCRRTVTVGGITIPQGADVHFPICCIHQLPQYWPEPHKFNPERFTTEAKANRPQLAYMPFSWGPRNCIGQRFALLNAKVALIQILKKFTFSRGPETVAKMKTKFSITLAPVAKVMLKILSRN